MNNLKLPLIIISVLCTIIGCERSPKNDIEKWVNENSTDRFRRLTLTRNGLQLHLVENGMPKTGTPRLNKSNKTLDGLFTEYDSRIERQSLAGQLKIVSIDKFAPEIGKNISDAMQGIKLTGKGSSFLVFHRPVCGEPKLLTDLERNQKELLDKLPNFTYTGNLFSPKAYINSGADNNIDRDLSEWFDEFAAQTIRQRPATCNQSFPPAYRISMLYIEGSKGVWVPENEMLLDDYTNAIVSNTCGFDDKVALPTWVWDSCLEKVGTIQEIDIGTALSHDFRYGVWVFSADALKPLLLRIKWRELLRPEKGRLYWKVHHVEERN